MSGTIIKIGRRQQDCVRTHYATHNIAIPGKIAATPCKQGNKQPVVVFIYHPRERTVAGRCLYIQLTSDKFVPTIRHNCICKVGTFVPLSPPSYNNNVLQISLAPPKNLFLINCFCYSFALTHTPHTYRLSIKNMALVALHSFRKATPDERLNV
jgi:hypothetical protein